MINDPDLVFITETWLSSNISDSEILAGLPFVIFRYDRKSSKGGGVCCLCKETLCMRQTFFESGTTADFLCLDLISPDVVCATRYILIYRAPSSSSHDDDELLGTLATMCSAKTQIVLLGDFNLDCDWSSRCPHNSSSSKFLRFFNECNLVQNVFEPTRGNAVLDLILTSDRIHTFVHYLPPFHTSDHRIIEFRCGSLVDRALLLPLPNFFKANYSAMNQYLATINWWLVFQNFQSVDDLYLKFCLVMYEVFRLFVPLTFRYKTTVKYPIHIQNLLNQKARLSSAPFSPIYKKVCSDINLHLKKFLANYERRLGKKSTTRQLFEYIRCKTKGSGNLPALEDGCGNTFVTDSQKAEAFAAYFSSVFSTDNDGFTSPVCDDGRSLQRLCRITFEEKDVLKHLKGLKESASTPFDGIPQIVFRKCARNLCKPLTMIFNISLMLETVPSMWREALITPIPKGTKSSLLANYRPISITPTPMKILEKIIREKLLCWLDKCNILPPEQHGFLKGASTATQLLDSTFEWGSALNNNLSVDIIYFDLSKAFDRVNHSKLILRLNQIGIDGALLKWFLSYASIKVQLYADDIKVYGIYGMENKCEIHAALTESIRRLMEWTNFWSLPVNLSKTYVMHLGRDQLLEYKYSDIVIKNCSEVKDLGIEYKDPFDFRLHINNIVRKAFSSIFFIFRNVHSNDEKILIRLYKAYVLPQLEYCCQVWSPHGNKRLQRQIEKVQQAFTRILTYRTHRLNAHSPLPSYATRLKMFGLKSLLYRRVQQDIILCFRILRMEVRLRSSKYWVFRPSSGRTRSFVIDCKPLRNRCWFKIYNSFFYRTARWLQMLPNEVLSSPNISVFKSRLKKIDILSVLNIQDF